MRKQGYGAVVRALRKKREAEKLATLGLSDVMWDALVELHRARLCKEQGLRKGPNDRTMVALWDRGLATYQPAPDVCPCGVVTRACSCCPRDAVLWSASAKGAAMVKEGRPS